MNSFLKRNITTSLFYSNGRNFSNNKSSLYSSMRGASNSIEKKNNSNSKYSLDNTIYSIFKITYNKEFPNILLFNSKSFLRNINTKAEQLIKDNIVQNINIIDEVNSFISLAKDKILNLYNEEFSFLKESFLNYIINVVQINMEILFQ